MLIKETIERECCQPQDLKPVAYSPMYDNSIQYKFCIHCGRRFQYRIEYVNNPITGFSNTKECKYFPIRDLWEKNPFEGVK